MSFPPNLGITNSLIIESDYCLLFQELSSILPTLNQIPSPFTRNKMNNGYSRIEKNPSTKRSKSVDFADLTSLHHHKPRSTPNFLTNPKLKTREITEPNTALKIMTIHDSIPEHESEEVFGIILSRKSSVSTAMAEQDVGKRSFSIRRSASVCEGYSRIDPLRGSSAEEDDDDDQCRGGSISAKKRCVKKKGKFFGAFRRLFGL